MTVSIDHKIDYRRQRHSITRPKLREFIFSLFVQRPRGFLNLKRLSSGLVYDFRDVIKAPR